MPILNEVHRPFQSVRGGTSRAGKHPRIPEPTRLASPQRNESVCRFVLPGMKMYEQDCFYIRLARKEFVSRLQITRPNGSSAHSQRLNVKYDVASRETNARVKRAQLQRKVKSKRLSICWTRSEEQQLKERSCFVDFKVLEKQKKTDESSYNDGQSHLKDPI